MNYLSRIKINKGNSQEFPYNLNLFKNGLEINFEKPITFILGDNGSGKSTLFESLAYNIGFNILGGNRNHSYTNSQTFDNIKLADNMKLSWNLKTSKGFF